MDQPDGLTRLVRTSSPPHPRAGRHRLRRSRCGGRSGSPGRGPASPPSEGRWPRGCPRRRSSRVVSSEMRDSSSRLLDAVPQVRPMSQRGASMACCTSKPKSIIRVSRARLGLRLAFATHGAVGQHRRTVPEQHGRDDAVEGGSCKARAGSGGGRRARRSCRGSASARRCRRRHGRAEIVVDQLNVRHHKAVAVGGAEIDGVAVSWPAVGSGTVAQARLDPADR